MAKPLSASRLVEILRAKGVTVHEVRNWRTHNRDAKGPWGPMNGVMIHHTVTLGTDSSVALCYDGYAPPPGPLCHGVIDKKWHVHMVGNGRGMRSRIANRLRGTPGGGSSDPRPQPRPEYEALPGACSFQIRPPRPADHRHGQAPGRGGLRPLRGGPEPRPPTSGQTVARTAPLGSPHEAQSHLTARIIPIRIHECHNLLCSALTAVPCP